MSNIKSLLDDHKKEILNHFKEETNSIKTLIFSLTNRIQDLESSLEATLDRVNALETKLSRQITVNSQDFEEACYEAEVRHQKRKSLIISGLPEHTHGTLTQRKDMDEQSVLSLAQTLEVRHFKATDVMRVGRLDPTRPRLLRVKCESVEQKQALLQKSRMLKGNSNFRNVFINPDQTITQRKRSQELRNELKRRREEGENVGIRRGRIVDLNNLPQDFHRRF